MALALPTIHLNGTSAQSLLDDTCDAAFTVKTAIDALARTAPNGRDYYLQGDDAMVIASGQHAERMARLRSVYAELQQIGEYLADKA
jgi:hypothetical protein